MTIKLTHMTLLKCEDPEVAMEVIEKSKLLNDPERAGFFIIAGLDHLDACRAQFFLVEDGILIRIFTVIDSGEDSMALTDEAFDTLSKLFEDFLKRSLITKRPEIREAGISDALDW